MRDQCNTHTPGPWHDTGLPAPYEHAISDENGVAVARVFRGPRMNGPYPAGHGRANAALIIAAPKLLAAARQALEWLMGIDDTRALDHVSLDMAEDLSRYRFNLRHAIACATLDTAGEVV
jgi:hypothetical protein